MKKIIKLIILLLSILGVVFLYLTINEFYLKDKQENYYSLNCKNIELGMTIEEVEEIMNKGLSISEQDLSPWIMTEEGIPEKIIFSHLFISDSKNIRIEIDINTELVDYINCGEYKN